MTHRSRYPGSRPHASGRINATQFKWLLRFVTIAALCAGLVVGLRVIRQHAVAVARSKAAPTMTTITVNPSAPSVGELSDRYIGLSFENATLNTGVFDDVGNLVPLLKNLGSSIMRFGGTSADLSSGISTDTLAGLDRVAKASGWSVIYTENLASYDPATVTADAQEVSAALGTRLFALSCGNEADQYRWKKLRPRSFNESGFLSDAASCLNAIRAGARDVALEGPDLAGTNWLAKYARQETGNVKWLGVHYYPLGCNKVTSSQTHEQLAATLLAPGTTNFEARTFQRDAADARTAHARLMMTETNTACAGGVRGLSDTYSTALWAIHFLLTGAENGVAAMNFHGGLDSNCGGYTPLCQTGPNMYAPKPDYYGLLFTHLLGSGNLLPVTVHKITRSENIAAFALKPLDGSGMRLMVENLSGHQTTIALRVGVNRGLASVLRLTGPSLLATSGLKIQGATVARDGSFKPGHPDTIRCAAGSCVLTLKPYTASLVTAP
jgi:hypothetical protein